MKKYILGVFILMFSLLVSIGIGIGIKDNSIDNIDNNIILLKKEINKINLDIKNEKTKLEEMAKNDIVKEENLLDKTIDELKIIEEKIKKISVDNILKDICFLFVLLAPISFLATIILIIYDQ